MRTFISRRIGISALLLAFSLGASPAQGMGKQPPVPVAPGDDRGLDLGIILNPYIMTLYKNFHAAKKPPLVEGDVVRDIAHGIEMGRRYDCRIFYALTRDNVTTPTWGTTWYQFSKFGDLFIDNQAYMDVGRIKTFAMNQAFANELLGRSDDRLLYEALRVMPNGDLIIESSTPPGSWLKAILSAIGLAGSIPEMDGKLQGLALASLVLNNGSYVVSYTYCPKDRSKLDHLEQLFY